MIYTNIIIQLVKLWGEILWCPILAIIGNYLVQNFNYFSQVAIFICEACAVYIFMRTEKNNLAQRTIMVHVHVALIIFVFKMHYFVRMLVVLMLVKLCTKLLQE